MPMPVNTPSQLAAAGLPTSQLPAKAGVLAAIARPSISACRTALASNFVSWRARLDFRRRLAIELLLVARDSGQHSWSSRAAHPPESSGVGISCGYQAPVFGIDVQGSAG